MAFISLLFYLIGNTCKQKLCKNVFAFVLQALFWYFSKKLAVHRPCHLDHHSPAMHHDGASAGRVGELDSPDKGKQPCCVVGHSMVRPAGEMELLNFPNLIVSPLCRHGKQCFQMAPNKVIKHSHEYQTRRTMKNVPGSCFFWKRKLAWHGPRSLYLLSANCQRKKMRSLAQFYKSG